MEPFSMFLVFFGCVALFIIAGIGLAVFSALFGRRRWGGYGMYRPRPLFPWFRGGRLFERREFYEPRHEHRYEHEHHRHHDGGFRDGGHHGGGFGGGGHHGGHH